MSELMSEAVNLMLVGMGFVFVFLVTLVFVTSAMSMLVNKYSPLPDPESVSPPQTVKVADTSDAQLLAVLSAAVEKYRSDHKN